jgi:hypothetical protein
MKFWLKKTLTILTVYFSLTGICFANQTQDLTWHKAHQIQIFQSIVKYIENNSLYPLLQKDKADIHLAKDPHELLKGTNYYISSNFGIICQREIELFAIFFVFQQINPYFAETLFMYTSDDNLHMPSLLLYSDVVNHPFVKQKQLPKKFNLHITTTNVDSKGAYTQDWIFYDENHSETITITFSSDGDLGTNFIFLND